MQRLNIPLDRSIHATRPYRRVVWLLALGAPACVAFLLAGWWFERPTIGLMAPEGTAIIFRLQPGPDRWKSVLNAAGRLTAVSDRALTLQELAPYSAGELIIYIDTTGRRSIGIRATETQIPHALLDAYGITVQSAKNGIALLTDRARPTEQIKLRRSSPWIGFGRIGTIYVRGERTWETGIITAHKNGWDVRLPKQPLPKNQFAELPEGTIAFLATPVLTTDIEVSGVTERMESILAPFDLPSLDIFGKELLKNKGGIIITEHQSHFSFLLGGQGAGVGEDGWRKTLLAAAAFRHPKTQPWLLPDGTKAQEIRVDPSTITLEERTILGTKVMQARPTPTETLLLALQTDGRYAFSDDESLLSAWLGQKTSSPSPDTVCAMGHPSAYIDLQKLYRVSESDLTFHLPSTLRDLSQTFRTVSLKKHLFSSVFQLCF